MFTKTINGHVYGLIKIPDYTTHVVATADDDPDYTWLKCNTSVRKRVQLNLADWRIIAPMGEISDEDSYAIGLIALATFVIESGLKDYQVLLVVKRYKFQ